ncbi:MAG: Acetoacetate decarboxylase (ADC) [Syntrophus sp. PtaB.Bin138]|nr:MAG: Acetoacetate decarboxylase (ADC) [Syntrophus sp. PtaB.Bin138]
MKKQGISRREFLKAGAGAAAGIVTASLLGCSGGSDGGTGNSDVSPNQAWTYHGQKGITAAYQPTNSALYRQLLPSVFDMPDTLQLVLSIISYSDVTQPLVPYYEGFAMLACKYRGQACLHTLTMPVTDKTANDVGISIGFPKYIADSIVLRSGNSTWIGEVKQRGSNVMRMTFTPQSELPPFNRSNPAPSYINLVPPGIGPAVVTVNIRGKQLVRTTTGSATVEVSSGESWSALLEGASLVGAQFDEITGNWTLVSGDELRSAVVSIVKIKNGRTDQAVEEAIELLGGIGAVTADKQKIMLKPNLVSDNPRSTTNPEVIRALASLMQGAGKEVSIGEGSAACRNYNILNGVVYRTRNRDTLDAMQQHIFDVLGYSEIARSLGIPLVNLHSGNMVEVDVPNGFVYDSIALHRSLIDIDMLCSVPMMKTHNLGGVTLGMKNLIGTYPGTTYGSVRSLVHDRAAAVERSGVAGAVIDIVRANKLGLVVIDASTAMEGNGPENGDPVKMDLIIAGTNPLATDMVGASVMGFYASAIPSFQWANNAGMQPQQVSQIEIRGAGISDVQRNFKRPEIIPWNTARNTFGLAEI